MKMDVYGAAIVELNCGWLWKCKRLLIDAELYTQPWLWDMWVFINNVTFYVVKYSLWN